MAELTFSDDVAEQLRALAAREGRSVDDVVREMMKQYAPAHEAAEVSKENEGNGPDALVGLIGLLDEYTDATDLSSTVRETLRQYMHPKYGTRRDRTD